MTSANENLPAGMGGLKYPVSQVSLVVNDLHRTMEHYYEAFGWTGWRVFDHVEPMHHGTQLRGQPVPYSLRGAEVMVGDLNFELLEPTQGPSLWREFLEARGEGIASIAVMFDTHEESAVVKDGFAKLGIDVTMRALIGDHIEYYYLDTQDRFGCLIESGSGHAIDFVSAAEIYPPEDGSVAPPAQHRPNQITQVSLVVRDLDAKMRAWHEAFGWGPWKIFRSDGKVVMHDCTLDGKPVDYFNIRWAEVMVGDLNFELIEPLGGDNPWQRMLDQHGEGIGSIAVMFKTNEESEAVKREFAQAGRGVTASGRIGDHIEWYYLDTQPAFKCVIESGSGHAIDFMTPEAVYP
jgi:glyoxalase/bleomycin resistance protein/dioxygenase superfamily protein